VRDLSRIDHFLTKYDVPSPNPSCPCAAAHWEYAGAFGKFARA